jgi:dTDP-4-amino-4,6-dideoxygalactose transaminase
VSEAAIADPVVHDPHPVRWPVYSPAAQEQAARLVAAGRTFDYGRGAELAALEDEFASSYGRRHAIAVNSGTSALFLAYAALGLRPGDEVVVPDYTFLATASALFWLGAVPRLADSDSVTGTVTAATVGAQITARTRAVVVTHLFGHPCDLAPIVHLCREHNLTLIEDCSHAHGSVDRTGSVARLADIAVFSTGGLKMVSGGLGGVLLTDDDWVHDIATLTSTFQGRPARHVLDPQLRHLADVGLGGNLRMSPVAAVLALSHLRALPDLVAAKNAAADQMIGELTRLPGLSAPPIAAGVSLGARYGVNLRYNPQVTGIGRDELLKRLQVRGLRVTPPRTLPLHRTSVFSGKVDNPDIVRRTSNTRFRHRPTDFPAAEALANSWIALPADHLHHPNARLLEFYVDGFTATWAEIV